MNAPWYTVLVTKTVGFALLAGLLFGLMVWDVATHNDPATPAWETGWLPLEFYGTVLAALCPALGWAVRSAIKKNANGPGR